MKILHCLQTLDRDEVSLRRIYLGTSKQGYSARWKISYFAFADFFGSNPIGPIGIYRSSLDSSLLRNPAATFEYTHL